ncbi:MAG: peptide deformylase [Peptococcaceae bacterium]|jgi:peptide deformylase|nr:peptide deformylase [Peptococcaceae bacterium]
MAVYQIVEVGADILREKAKEIKEMTPNVTKLLDNLLDTLYASENGIGLAAPQIGVSKRAIVIDIGEGPVELINPVILESRGEQVDSEGCLSIPDTIGDVTRAAELKVRGLDRQGQPLEIEAKDLLARVLQHEIDHLEGVLFIDRAKKTQRVR